MYRILIIILVLLTIQASGQDYGYRHNNISLDVRKQVNLLKKHQSFHTKAIGFGGNKSDTYKCFEKLQSKASTQEFIELCKHPSPVVRFYAFYELQNRKVDEKILLSIIKTHLNDTHRIITRSGCEGSEEEIGSLMFSHISNRYKKEIKLKHEFDSLFFFSKEPLIHEANEYLFKLPKSQKNNSRLKEMVKEENNPHALLPLLDYNNPEDWINIQYVLTKSNKIALEAIKRYPRSEFIPYLISLQQKYIKPEASEDAISEWPINHTEYLEIIYTILLNMGPEIFKKQTLQFIESPINNEAKQFHAEVIYNLIKPNTDSWVTSMINKLLPYLQKIDKKHLYTQIKDHKESIEILRKRLFINTNKLHFITTEHLIHALQENQKLDSISFYKRLLTEVPNDITFSIVYDKLISADSNISQKLCLMRFYQTLKKENPTLSHSLIDKLRKIKDEKIRSYIWWECYHHILNKNNFCSSFLQLMQVYQENQTIRVCFDIIKANTASNKLKWSAFHFLHNQENQKINNRLK